MAIQLKDILSNVLRDKIEDSQKIENELKHKSQEIISYKIKKISINSYKMFSNFNLNLSENINIIAGINGTGKTTFLEFIYNFIDYISRQKEDQSFINVEYYDVSGNKKQEILNFENSFVEYNVNGVTHVFKSSVNQFIQRKIIYIPALSKEDNIKNILPRYLEKMVYEMDIRASEAYQALQNQIKLIFDGLDLYFEFDSRDRDGNLFFRTNNGERFLIDQLSTGEKTLLSKVLYLYLNEVNNTVILIDEPELSLHPSWQSKVLKIYENFAKEYNCQIIIATHSPHIIGSAQNESVKLLTFDENHHVKVVDNPFAYGRDINWVLTQVMGATTTREQKILDQFSDIEKLLDQEEYQEAEERIDHLESVIGEHDSEIVRLRTILEFERD